MIFLENIRQHVIEDAGDLISLLGLVDPLIGAPRLTSADDIAHAGRLLRRVLSRYLVLVVCRLHENAGSGPTGVTASIDSLLDHAKGQIDDERGAELKQKRREIIASLEAEGINFRDLRSFRTAEIAHSLHRESNASDNSLYYSNISIFARRTYDLVLEIEQELVATGSVAFTDLPYLNEAWERRAAVIWKAALEDEVK